MFRVGYRRVLPIFVKIKSLVHVIVNWRNGWEKWMGDLVVVVVYEILCRGRLDKLPILDDVFN